jgi:hypothetical protein
VSQLGQWCQGTMGGQWCQGQWCQDPFLVLRPSDDSLEKGPDTSTQDLRVSWAAWPSTPGRTRVVTDAVHWHRYVPETGNWHGGTCTRWIAALSATPVPVSPMSHSSNGGREPLPARDTAGGRTGSHATWIVGRPGLPGHLTGYNAAAGTLPRLANMTKPRLHG